MRLSLWPILIFLAGFAYYELSDMHAKVGKDKEITFAFGATKPIDPFLIDPAGTSLSLRVGFSSVLDGVVLAVPEGAINNSTLITAFDRMGQMGNLAGAWGIGSALSLQTKEPLVLAAPMTISVPFPAEYWDRSAPKAYEVEMPKRTDCDKPRCKTGILATPLPVTIDESEKRFQFKLSHIPAVVTWYYLPQNR